VRYGFQMPCWARGTAAEPAALVLLERLVGSVVTVPPGCSGGGGLLPVTYPDVSRGIADARLAEFAEQGVTKLVTGCASGARRFRAAGSAQTPEVVELTTLLWEGLGKP
jgi:Fe-S oxidoreductase